MTTRPGSSWGSAACFALAVPVLFLLACGAEKGDTGSAPGAGGAGTGGSGVSGGGASGQAGAGGLRGTAGAGNTGGGTAGAGNVGGGTAGSGNVGGGNAGAGNAGGGNAGSGNAGSGNAGSGNAGGGNAGSGNAGSGNAGSGNAGSGNAGSGGAGAAGTGGAGDGGLTYRRANLTNFTSYPDPGSEECVEFNGCMWAGQFAFVEGQQPESWVMSHNIAAVHSRDAGTYQLKTLRLRKDGRQIDVTVYDMCADSDCSGCCTANSRETGFLIDIERYTAERFGVGDGIVEWACLDCGGP